MAYQHYRNVKIFIKFNFYLWRKVLAVYKLSKIVNITILLQGFIFI